MARWTVRLSNPAERDFVEIVGYTADNFGARQARVYDATLRQALAALRAGPTLRGTVDREDVGVGLRSLHVARKGRRGRHLILYREGPERTIEVVRILHDAMDLKEHVRSKE